MYLRMKVRTLFLLVGAVLCLCVAGYVLIPQWLLRAEAYNTVSAYFPFSPQAPQALLLAAEQADPTPGPSFVDILPGNEMATVGNAISPQRLSLAEASLKQLTARYPKSPYVPLARWQLALIEEQSGDWSGAVKELKRIGAVNGPHQGDAKKELQRLIPGLAASTGLVEVTGRVTDGPHPLDNVYVFLRSRTDSHSLSTDVQNDYPGAYTDKNGVYQIADVPTDGLYQVGVGVSPAQVTDCFLPIPADALVRVEKGRVAHYDVRFVPRVIVNEPTGGDAVRGDQITFSWDPYPGASTYRLYLTDFIGRWPKDESSISVQLPGAFKRPTASFPKAKLRNLLWGPAWDSKALSPASVLGVVYPGGEFSWYVDAYEASGKLLSSSRGYYIGSPDQSSHVPIFYTSTAGQLAGDRYLLQFQIEKAKSAYLKEVPNPYALRALAIMALYGSHPDDKSDPQRALHYLKQIQNPTPDIQRLMEEAEKDLK